MEPIKYIEFTCINKFMCKNYRKVGSVKQQLNMCMQKISIHFLFDFEIKNAVLKLI